MIQEVIFLSKGMCCSSFIVQYSCIQTWTAVVAAKMHWEKFSEVKGLCVI
jgi:hypothetical protein